jgi:hypothetical protein
MKLYKNAEILCPHNIVNLSNISMALEKQKDITSEVYAKQIIDLYPKSSKGYIRLARVNTTNKKEE